MPREKPLYLLKGKFKTGQAATALMQGEAGNYVEWSMTAGSEVNMRPSSPLTTALPEQVLPLQDFLSALELQGHVRVKLHKHKVEKPAVGPGVPGGSSDKFLVTSAEPVALEPNVKETGSPTLGSLGSYVDLGQTKASDLVRIVHRLEYDPKAKNITCGYPGIHLKKSLRISAGQAIPLVVVATGASVPAS